MKYVKINTIDSDYRHYLGTIGAYGILFGHKVSPQLRRKANYIWKRLVNLYYP